MVIIHQFCIFVMIQLLEELDLIPADSSKFDGEAYPEKNRYTYNLPCQSPSKTETLLCFHLIHSACCR